MSHLCLPHPIAHHSCVEKHTQCRCPQDALPSGRPVHLPYRGLQQRKHTLDCRLSSHRHWPILRHFLDHSRVRLEHSSPAGPGSLQRSYETSPQPLTMASPRLERTTPSSLWPQGLAGRASQSSASPVPPFPSFTTRSASPPPSHHIRAFLRRTS